MCNRCINLRNSSKQINGEDENDEEISEAGLRDATSQIKWNARTNKHKRSLGGTLREKIWRAIPGRIPQRKTAKMLTTSGKRLQQHSSLVNISHSDTSMGDAERERRAQTSSYFRRKFTSSPKIRCFSYWETSKQEQQRRLNCSCCSKEFVKCFRSTLFSSIWAPKTNQPNLLES